MTKRLLTKVSVFIALRNESGSLLMQQRSNTGYMDGYWDLTATGHMEYGETIIEAALRELFEGVGVTANARDLRLLCIGNSYLDTLYTNFIFLLDKWQGKPRIIEPDKCSGLEYFSLDALPDKITRGARMLTHTGIPSELSILKLTPENYEEYMGEPYLA